MRMREYTAMNSNILYFKNASVVAGVSTLFVDVTSELQNIKNYL